MTILSALVVGFCCGYLFARHMQGFPRNRYAKGVDILAAKRRDMDIKDWE
jgi:hypothetical protein